MHPGLDRAPHPRPAGASDTRGLASGAAPADDPGVPGALRGPGPGRAHAAASVPASGGAAVPFHRPGQRPPAAGLDGRGQRSGAAQPGVGGPTAGRDPRLAARRLEAGRGKRDRIRHRCPWRPWAQPWRGSPTRPPGRPGGSADRSPSRSIPPGVEPSSHAPRATRLRPPRPLRSPTPGWPRRRPGTPPDPNRATDRPTAAPQRAKSALPGRRSRGTERGVRGPPTTASSRAPRAPLGASGARLSGPDQGDFSTRGSGRPWRGDQTPWRACSPSGPGVPFSSGRSRGAIRLGHPGPLAPGPPSSPARKPQRVVVRW